MIRARHRIRIGTGLVLAAGLLGLAGCSGGGSGSGGGTVGTSSGSTPGASIAQVPGVSATLKWVDASGPVAGYRVMVSRNGGTFAFSTDTASAQVVVTGQVGDVVRIEVAAFDTNGSLGPLSPPSDPFQFAGPAPVTSPAGGTGGTTPPSTPPATDPGTSGSGGSTSGGSISSGGTGGSSGSTGTSGGSTGSTSGSTGDPPPATDPTPSTIPARLDFDGDGAADLVWEAIDGSQVRITHSDLSHARVFTSPDPSWRVAAVGDFDGDGLTDLLFSAPGQLALASGKALQASTGDLPLASWAPLGDGAQVVTSGDFDGDGATDVVVVDAAGAASLELANGQGVALPAPDPGTTIVGAGDADGDGTADLLLRDAQGAYSIWHIVGGQVQETIALPAPAGAALQGVADFDADHADEVALRTAPDTLLMQRARAPFDTWLETAPAGRDLVGCGDYDGDGIRDRLWADADSLELAAAAGTDTIVSLATESSWHLVPSCQ